MIAEVAVLLVVGGALAGPILLYWLVRVEHDQRDTMDRETAERIARRDTDEWE